PAPDGLANAAELIEFIRERGDFCIGAACYPEVHPEARTAVSDMAFTKHKVDAGADFLISQLFFDNGAFFEWRDGARAEGIDVPVIAGIMPVTNVGQIKRFTKMCGATLPPRFVERLESLPDEEIEICWTGVQYAAYQCSELLSPDAPDPFAGPARGADGIHFYTLNKSPATRAIFEILRLSRASL